MVYFVLHQKQATVRSSVLEVLLEITKYCDLYLMETVLDDESEVSANLCFMEFYDSSYNIYNVSTNVEGTP